MIVSGCFIPLSYLTPKLLFYPLKLPDNILLFLLNRDSINCINEKNALNLNERDHLSFVKTLMQSFNRSYHILKDNDILIDLSRQDFQLIIDDENPNNINIVNYKTVIKVIYITEKYLKKIIKILKLDYDIVNNITDIQDYIGYHCRRIFGNTQKMEQFIKNEFTAHL